jgi:hypothetical protein
MSALILSSLLGAFAAIFSSSVYAEVVTFPFGYDYAIVHLEVVKTGGTTIFNEFEDNPAHLDEFGDSGQFTWFAQLDSGTSGLQTLSNLIRTPVFGGFDTRNGNVVAELVLRDRIIISPDDCDALYSDTSVQFECFLDEDTSVALRPNAQASVFFFLDVGTVSTNVGSAAASAIFKMDYGGLVAQASWDRCLNATPGAPEDCSVNPDGLFDGFAVNDEDKDPGGFSGQMDATGGLLQLGITQEGGGIGHFVLIMSLKTSAFVGGQGDVKSDVVITANKTFTYAKSGPVFDLPEGWTAWSTSGLVQKNLYVAPPIFKDGFESNE